MSPAQHRQFIRNLGATQKRRCRACGLSEGHRLTCPLESGEPVRLPLDASEAEALDYLRAMVAQAEEMTERYRAALRLLTQTPVDPHAGWYDI